jgi:uncharacterized protein YcfL
MGTKIGTKILMNRAVALFTIVMMLFAALPAFLANAASLDITSVASGTWEATAWPKTQRSGTISVPLGSTTVTGTGTAFLTELSVGNILWTTTDIQIGTVASITSDTELTLVSSAVAAHTDISYLAQGVGPADHAIIADTHTVTIDANPVNQAATVTVNAGGTLVVSSAGTSFDTLTVDGTVTADEGAAFGIITVNSGGTLTAGGEGTYTASSLTVNSGGTANILQDLTVDSETLIAGTINFGSTDSTSRAMKFLGAVTLQSGAVWNEATAGNGVNNTYSFFDDFTNDASLFTTSATAIHAFGGAGKVIEGTTSTSIALVTVTGTYTNNGTLTVGTTLLGTGKLTNSASGTLNLAGNASINALDNAGTLNKTGAGPISTPLANFTNTGTIHLNGTGTLTGITNNAGGVVNLVSSGTITAFNNATATSVLNISALGTPPNISTLTVTAPGNTVNYNGAGDQTVIPTTYSNLILSGSGDKSVTMPDDSTLTTNDLTIAPTGTARAAITGSNLGVNSLTLGNLGTINGTWGSSASAATFTNDTFFALTAGYLNVVTDTRSTQTISFTSTAPTNAEVGGATYSPAATATSGLPVDFTIDASAASVCTINAGEVSLIGAGTCVINANQAGNESYLPATQVQQSFTVSAAPSTASVFIADQEMQDSPFGLAPGEIRRQSFAGVSDGPVQIEGNVDIVASERAIYKVRGVYTSFSELMGLPNAQLDNTYWLPWYNNTGLDTQLRFANVTDSTATVHIFIGDNDVTPADGINLPAGESTRVSYPVNDGPVQIVSDQDIVAAERVIYTVQGVQTSFSEMMALPASQLDKIYWLPWYNNVGLDTQLRIANVTTTTASVQVLIAGEEMEGSPFTLEGGDSTRLSFDGINNGPVQIISDQDIVAAERVIYKVQGNYTSFSEMMALPNSQLDTTYWLPWYNNAGLLDTQLRIGNVSGSTATVHVFIAGNEVTPAEGIVLGVGASTRLSYLVNDGPVQIVSDQNIVAAQRVIYSVQGVQTSFSEMMALPNSQVDTTYWFPWYNNLGLDTQLRFGMPSP